MVSNGNPGMAVNRPGISFLKTLLLAFVLVAASLGQAVLAEKITAKSLASQRGQKDFEDSSAVAPALSRFQRRLDYRQAELLQKQAQAEAEARAVAAQNEQVQKAKQKQQMALQANSKAVALGKQGRWTDAIEAHENAVSLDPANKQLRVNLSAARTILGQQKLAAGDAMAAASHFRKALMAAPDNGLAGKSLADALKRMGRDPLSADIRLATGDQLAAAGDYQAAAIEYQAALQLDNTGRAYVKMGDMALRYGQLSTAHNWYRQAIVKDPNTAAAHRQLGLIAVNQKDFSAAATSLRKAIILDPKDTLAGQTLVELWRRQVAANPLLAENHLGLAGALQLNGDFAGADTEYRKLEVLDAKNPGLAAGRASLGRAIQHAKSDKHFAAAETFLSQGLRREALAEIGQAVMSEPKNVRYQFLFAECLESNGDYNGAHQAYHTCVLNDSQHSMEAAARMKEMQNSQKVQSTRLNQATLPTQAAASFKSPAENSVQVSSVATPLQAGRKDMFEAGPGSQVIPGNLNFRTHDDSQATAAPPSAVAAKAAAEVLDPGLTAVAQAEAAKDYNAAINLLRPILTRNLQNAELHHRMAVGLLSTGQISESIAEFRIASALNPNQKSYADDLSSALTIHKRSLANTQANTGLSHSNQGATP